MNEVIDTSVSAAMTNWDDEMIFSSRERCEQVSKRVVCHPKWIIAMWMTETSNCWHQQQQPQKNIETSY